MHYHTRFQDSIIISRPLEHVHPDARIRLAHDIGRLPCLLTLCSGEDCSAFRKEDGPPTVHHYVPVLVSLLRGEDDEVNPLVKRKVFQAMRSILRHRNEEDPGSETMDVIFQGLVDTDRSTRLQAGYIVSISMPLDPANGHYRVALSAVVQHYARHVTRPGNVTAVIFDRIYQQIDNGAGPVKETLVVAVGKMGT